MVFPSLMFQIDQGVVSQLSAWIVILFSFFLYRFKKIVITFFIVLFAVVLFQSHAFAIGPSNYGSSYQYQQYQTNNMNYYGRPTGYSAPVYFYPQLPYQSMWPQQNSYFPHTPSPYQPADCPFCNQMQNYQQQQPLYFPNSYQYPGGGIT